MEQLKSLDLINEDKKKVSLESFVSFCINKSLEISKWKIDDFLAERLEYEIINKYNWNQMVTIRMYSPILGYLITDKSEKNKKGEEIITREALLSTKCIIPAICVLPDNLLNEEEKKQKKKTEALKYSMTEKAKNLTDDNKNKIVQEIIAENKKYFEAIIQKFNLDILIR